MTNAFFCSRMEEKSKEGNNHMKKLVYNENTKGLDLLEQEMVEKKIEEYPFLQMWYKIQDLE